MGSCRTYLRFGCIFREFVLGVCLFGGCLRDYFGFGIDSSFYS